MKCRFPEGGEGEVGVSSCLTLIDHDLSMCHYLVEVEFSFLIRIEYVPLYSNFRFRN